jgi:hypothetical protein
MPAAPRPRHWMRGAVGGQPTVGVGGKRRAPAVPDDRRPRTCADGSAAPYRRMAYFLTGAPKRLFAQLKTGQRRAVCRFRAMSECGILVCEYR